MNIRMIADACEGSRQLVDWVEEGESLELTQIYTASCISGYENTGLQV